MSQEVADTLRKALDDPGRGDGRVTVACHLCGKKMDRQGSGAHMRWRHTDEFSEFNRFLGAIHMGPGCWVWKRSVGDHGYGTVHWEGGTELAHRLAYKLWVGPIPAGLSIDHLCRNKRCVNPRHLEAVTQRTNVLRGMAPSAVAAREDRCPKGHPFTPENTYWRPDGSRRRCKECARANRRQSWARRRDLRMVS